MISPRPAVEATLLAEHGGRRAGAIPARLDFSTCVNAFGAADVVRDAVRHAPPDDYPDPQCRAPHEALAVHVGRPIEEIALAAGTVELIQAVCWTYVRENDTVCIAAPAFGEYARMARLCGARVHELSFATTDDDERAAQWDAIIASVRPRLTFVCTPSNPTGRCVPYAALRTLATACEACGGLLVLDQAYDPFSARPAGVPALPGHPAVLHLRSLTKDHALAGVRVGFGIGPPPVMQALARVRVPWSVSAAAQAAALATVTSDAQTHVQRTTTMLRAERLRLGDACARLGFTAEPSDTHYFLLPVAHAASFRTTVLRTAGIAVRDCTSFGLPDQVRIAARTPAENDALLRTLALAELDPFRGASPDPLPECECA